MPSIQEEYRHCAEICSRIDYADMKSVRANNRAVRKKYKIVEAAVHQGSASIDELVPILDEPLCAIWLAHQLLQFYPYMRYASRFPNLTTAHRKTAAPLMECGVATPLSNTHAKKISNTW